MYPIFRYYQTIRVNVPAAKMVPRFDFHMIHIVQHIENQTEFAIFIETFGNSEKLRFHV